MVVMRPGRLGGSSALIGGNGLAGEVFVSGEAKRNRTGPAVGARLPGATAGRQGRTRELASSHLKLVAPSGLRFLLRRGRAVLPLDDQLPLVSFSICRASNGGLISQQSRVCPSFARRLDDDDDDSSTEERKMTKLARSMSQVSSTGDVRAVSSIKRYQSINRR